MAKKMRADFVTDRPGQPSHAFPKCMPSVMSMDMKVHSFSEVSGRFYKHLVRVSCFATELLDLVPGRGRQPGSAVILQVHPFEGQLVRGCAVEFSRHQLELFPIVGVAFRHIAGNDDENIEGEVLSRLFSFLLGPMDPLITPINGMLTRQHPYSILSSGAAVTND
ncbi:hypothetical protein CJ030_MR4G009208 [Morella rubra]|uniref:Uncharacterized protein n=1 Tax=Morella rubra TaxID=262757 RepID=A0A6A1VYP0_9ROSI|nr:hypothetical protein CJ030_MR4G009208 [Morella rubra]